jgi:hypothetical protein
VLLALHGGQHDDDAGPAPDDAKRLALQRDDAQRDLRGQVLFGHRQLARLPEVAHRTQRRRDDDLVDVALGDVGLDGVAQDDLRARLVAAQQRVGELALQLLQEPLLHVVVAGRHSRPLVADYGTRGPPRASGRTGGGVRRPGRPGRCRGSPPRGRAR